MFACVSEGLRISEESEDPGKGNALYTLCPFQGGQMGHTIKLPRLVLGGVCLENMAGLLRSSID
jgi:hypothetical protein